MTLEEVVADFIRKWRTHARREMEFYGRQPTLRDVIRTAASCNQENGKRHPHQRCGPAVIREMEQRLLAHADALGAARSFEELHARVRDTIGPILGVAEVTVYHVAQRIGAFLSLEPEVVHLHAGAAQGAKALGLRGKTITLDQLPPAFAALSPAEAEDCLCLYKDALRGLARVGGCRPRRMRSGCRAWAAAS